MEKVYIAGPVDNEELFIQATNALINCDMRPVSSLGLRKILAKKFSHREPTFEEFMQVELENLLKCDGIMLLPEWKESKEAVIEHYVAKAVGKPFVRVKELAEHWGRDLN